MPGITYPVSITNEKEKLSAIYSLLEQMRLEHNKAGGKALTDKKLDKWSKYAEIFATKQLPLLQEQNRLKDAIRKTVYSDKEWMSFSNEQLQTISIELFGDKQVEKSKKTEATSDDLESLKLVDIDSLVGNFVDPTENLTTFTEGDPGTKITIDAAKITCSGGYDTGSATWVYKSYGANHFGDFEHLFRANISNTAGMVWSIAGNYHTEKAMNDADNGIRCTSWNGSFYFRDETNGNYDSGAYAGETNCYCKVNRTGTTATFKWYSDSGRTTLIDTLTLTCGTQTYEYLNALGSLGSGSTTGWIVYLGDFDLQEAGATTAYKDISALFKTGDSKTVALDTRIKATETSTVALDTLMKGLGVTSTVALSALLRTADSKTVNLDAILKAIDARSVNIDALIKGTGISANVLLDVIIGGVNLQTVSLDVLLKALGVSTTALIDTLIKTGDTKTVSLDALLKTLGVNQTVAVDAILKAADSKTLSLDALIRELGVTQSVAIDAILSGVDNYLRTILLDSLFRYSDHQTLTIDTIIGDIVEEITAGTGPDIKLRGRPAPARKPSMRLHL